MFLDIVGLILLTKSQKKVQAVIKKKKHLSEWEKKRWGIAIQYTTDSDSNLSCVLERTKKGRVYKSRNAGAVLDSLCT